MPEYVSFRQLADRAGCSIQTPYNYERRKELAVVKIGGLKLVTAAEARRFVRAVEKRRALQRTEQGEQP